jgi:two-component system chemotaxis response regulator CheY
MGGIMVVDDKEYIRIVIKKIALQMGLEVAGEARNGVEAIRLYALLKPDLVIMDIPMPEMNGLKALCEIRKMDPMAKIIICSAMVQQKIVIDAINCGAKEFIAKPFQAEQIKQTIKRVLAAK